MYRKNIAQGAMVKALQQHFNETQGADLPPKYKKAVGRAIWYVVVRGWGYTTAASRVSGSFSGVSEDFIQRSLKQTFPPNYFANLSRAKNTLVIKQLAENN